MELQCTPCGQPVDLAHDEAVIVGIDLGGRLHFRWACRHKPPPDNPDVVLASNGCCIKWVHAHMEYDEEISLLLAAADENLKHSGCDKENNGTFN